ncbi:MAG: S1C family serine protease [Planctomycetota bacterium]
MARTNWRGRVPRLVAIGLLWGFGLGSFCLAPVGGLAAQEIAADEQRLQAMQLTSKAFRAAAAKIRPALVTIESFGGVSAVQGKIGGIRQQGEGNTTGVMISPDGYIVTSTFNFIQRPPVITVITSDGQRRVAQLLGRDDTRKICLRKIEGVQDMPVPELVAPANVQVGQWAVSVGVGFGDTNAAVSAGVISAKNRVGGKAIQTDANISPACYGGPLIDLDGRLIGICVPLNPQSQAIGAGVEWYDSGIGFAIPLSGAESLLERLKTGERIMPAFLGVQGAPDPQGRGLQLSEVVAGSGASAAGLQPEDVLLALAGEPAKDVMSLRKILGRFEAGAEVEVELIPKGESAPKKIKLVLGAPPADPNQSQLEPPKIR